jgi:hypothetical protein
MQAKRLSYYPFDSISLHGPFDLPVHTDPNPALAEVVVEYDQREAFAVQSLALFVHLFKLPPLAQQMIFPESEHLVTIRQTAVSVPWRGGRLK